MTGPPVPEKSVHTAEVVLGLLRLFISTGAHPADTKPAALKRMAATYTGRLYQSGKAGVRSAIRDLEAWIAAAKGNAK